MLQCDLPHNENDAVLLAHGGGGRLSHQLVEKIIKPHFKNSYLNDSHDGCSLPLNLIHNLAFSTDSYVIKPLYFPGGSIAELAVYGTVNDLAMCGAEPQFLSCSFILEEGFSLKTLEDLCQRMGRAAQECGVQIVTGDTKVVEKGQGDEIFINTAGIGQLLSRRKICRSQIQNGDAIILSGDLGRHSLAIMAQRQGLELQSKFTSDLAPLHRTTNSLLKSGLNINCLRDLTRGGLASALFELQDERCLGMTLEKNKIPVHEEVQSLCEIMGYDPMNLSNEGCFLMFVPSSDQEETLAHLHHLNHRDAAIIGHVHCRNSYISIKNELDVETLVDWPLGDPMPRIC